MYSVEWVVSGDGEDPNGDKKKKKKKKKKKEKLARNTTL